MAFRNEVDKHLQLNTLVKGQRRAPVYSVPDRGVVAIEHPMIVKNIDKALRTFGTNRPFRRVSIPVSQYFTCVKSRDQTRGILSWVSSSSQKILSVVDIHIKVNRDVDTRFG